MVSRIQSDAGVFLPSLQPPSLVSAQLGPSPVAQDAEAPSIAVPGVANLGNESFTSFDTSHTHDYAVFKIKIYGADLTNIQNRQEELKKLREKLFSTYKQIVEKNSPNKATDNADSRVNNSSNETVLLQHLKLLGSGLKDQLAPSATDQIAQFDQSQKVILQRISRAIERIDAIQSRLTGDADKTSALLALSSSIDGLNSLSNSVVVSNYGEKTANQICDSIIQNASLAIMAQGNITASTVNLALS
jgi:hypothetical protein